MRKECNSFLKPPKAHTCALRRGVICNVMPEDRVSCGFQANVLAGCTVCPEVGGQLTIFLRKNARKINLACSSKPEATDCRDDEKRQARAMGSDSPLCLGFRVCKAGLTLQGRGKRGRCGAHQAARTVRHPGGVSPSRPPP